MFLNFRERLPAGVALTRASSGTVVDAMGRVTYAASNLLTRSSDFASTAWIKYNDGTATQALTAGQADPLGGNDASRVEWTAGGYNLLTQNLTPLPGMNYRLSVWMKGAVGGEIAKLDFFNGSSNGTAGQQVTLTDQWARYSVKVTSVNALGGFQFRKQVTATAQTFSIFGAQVEHVTYQTAPSPYLATVGVAAYGPRFTHDSVTLDTRGLLSEEARTNLLLRSAEFDNSYWTTAAAAIVPNDAVAPDGTATADRLTCNTPGAYASVFRTEVVANATAYTLSVFARARTGFILSLELRGSPAGVDAVFDLSDGTVISGAGAITPAGNGWYRCSVRKTSIDTSEIAIFGMGAANLHDSIHVWGAQLEQGVTPTSYIPTTAVAVTRAAEPSSVQTVQGDNLVQNATGLSTTAHWNDANGATLDVNAGRLRLTGTAGGYAWQAIPVVVGRPYRLTADFTRTAANSTLFAGNAAGGTHYGVRTLTASGAAMLTLVPTQPLIFIGVSIESGGPTVAEWGNFSCREAVPTAFAGDGGWDNGAASAHDLYAPARVGVAAGGGMVTAVGTTISYSGGSLTRRAYLNLNTRPGRPVCLIALADKAGTYFTPKAGRDGVGGNLVASVYAATAGQVAFTFVPTSAFTTLEFENAAAFSVSAVRVAEVSAQAPAGGSAPDLLDGAGHFGSTAGWTAENATVEVGDGLLTLTTIAGDTTPRAHRTITGLRPGHVYRVWGSARRGTSAGNARVLMADVSGSPTAVSSSGTALTAGTVEFVAGGISHRLMLEVDAIEGGTTAMFGDIEVREGGLVRNGDFASGEGWTTGAYWSIDPAGHASRIGDDFTYSALSQSVAVVAGRTYRLTYRLVRSDGAVTPWLGGTPGSERSTSGTYSELFTPAGTGTLQFRGNGTFGGTIDDVVLVEVGAQGAGAVAAQFSLPAINPIRASDIINLNDGTGGENIRVHVEVNGAVIALVQSAGANQALLSLGMIAAGEVARVAISWGYDAVAGTNFFRGSLNGAAALSATPARLPQIGRLDILNEPGGNRAANGCIRWIAAARHGLSAAELPNWQPDMTGVGAVANAPAGRGIAVVEATTVAVGANDNMPVGRGVATIEATVIGAGAAAQAPAGAVIGIAEAMIVPIGASVARPRGRSVRLVHTPVALVEAETPVERRAGGSQESRRGLAQ
ncbi:hypothetical protein ACFOMD_01765 [Sphingoaurantiacus capsulatus]|uniref:CBM-cenC domain-containing protein n=1 Tax=Sphingoaurantiacus capsulatus TaxID=1771310 RepID=A0ABV7X865_9SPHN